MLRQVTALSGMVHHLEGIDLDGDGVADIPPLEALGPHPMDPGGRLRWQALLENRQHAVQAVRQRSARRKESNNQALLAALRTNDPYFGHVMRWIENFVESLPDRIKRGVVEQVDRTPGAFLEMYRDLRKHFLEEFLGQRCSAPEAAPSAPGVRSGVARRPSPQEPQPPTSQSTDRDQPHNGVQEPRPYTYGTYAQQVNAQKGDYFTHDNKAYYRRDGKTYLLTGDPERGDEELSPDTTVR